MKMPKKTLWILTSTTGKEISIHKTLYSAQYAIKKYLAKPENSRVKLCTYYYTKREN